MNHGIINPPKILADYVKYFWFIEGDVPYVHHAFAYPCPELIFCYKGSFNYGVGKNSDTRLISGVFGQTETFSRVTLNKEQYGILGVYLYPHSFLQLFKIPASELTNQYTDMKTLLGEAGKILEEQIALAPGNDERVQVLIDFLKTRLSNARTELTAITFSIKNIVNTYQSGSVRALAESHFLSLRQFERKFKELSGFSPKSFFRIARFNSVLNSDYGNKSLTQIGIDCGYFDQAHFIHDFQKFSGLTPKKYFRKETIAASDRGTVEF